MRALYYAKKLYQIDKKILLVYIEALIFLIWGRILLFMPFSKLAPKLGKAMHETTRERSLEDKKQALQIGYAIQRMSKFTIWKSTCLIRAIAAMKMLERRNMDSTLYLGTGKDQSGSMIAHAWLRSGTVIVTGADAMKNYTVVSKFAKTVNEGG